MTVRGGGGFASALLAVGFATSCGSGNLRPASPTVAPLVDATYDARLGDGVLVVDASLPAGTPEILTVDDEGQRFVREPEVWDGAAWQRLTLDRKGVHAPSCVHGCRVRYRFLLRDAAVAIDDIETARAFGDAILAPPSTWLVEASRPYTLRSSIGASKDGVFLSGLEEAKVPEALSTARVYRAREASPREAPFTALGAWRARRIAVGASSIDLTIAPAKYGVSDDVIESVVSDAARGIASYYGTFPVPHLLVAVGPEGGAETLGGGGASIFLPIEARTREAELRQSWVPTHEMIHVSFPSIPREQRWLSEGLATYVEPLVRARAGVLSVEALWRDFVRDAPQGLPAPGDRGLDGTASWGRTYWGGAIFCLLADVRIREQTAGRRSLDDVLRAIVKAGGTVYSRWNLAHVLEIGDAAASIPVLEELYRSMAHAAVSPDLAGLFKKLGVSIRGEAVVFDDEAPLAWVRKAMTARNQAGHAP